MHIFIAEDEGIIRRELKILLENSMYQVTAAEDFENLSELIKKADPDLILLDVNLPGISGFEVCTQIRAVSEIPVIFLTSRTDSMDELTGILKGGDDYITKPYQAPILLARIAAVLKRTKGAALKETTVYTHKGGQLDLSRCCLTFGEKQIELTKNGFFSF